MQHFSFNPCFQVDYNIQGYVYPQYNQYQYYETYPGYSNLYHPYIQSSFCQIQREQIPQNENYLKKQQQNGNIGGTTQATGDLKKVNAATVQQTQEQSESSQYSPAQNRMRKRKKNKKCPKYLKKNTQSNISNQIFSYISTKRKSEQVLCKAIHQLKLDQSKIVPAYYQYMKVIRKQKRKYLNKIFISSLCNLDESNPFTQKIKELYKIQDLSFMNFSKLAFILANFFLNNICHLSIIQSKKMDKQTRLDHLDRRRKIFIYLKEQKMRG